MMNDMMPARYRSIDIARGIGILAIIFGHLGVALIVRVVFTFHVPIFYLITGYFAKAGEVVPFAKRRARSLLIPYFITCLAIVVIAAVMAAIESGDVLETVKAWVMASIYGAGSDYKIPVKPIGAIWFLWSTFWGSLFLKLSLKWKTPKRLLWVTILFLFGWYTAKTLFWFPLSIQAGCCATLFMYIGYVAKVNERRIRELPRTFKIVASMAAFIIWVYYILSFQSFWLVRCDIGRGVVDILGSICACYCVYAISVMIDTYFEIISQWLSFLGRYSVIVLCVHITEMNMIDWKSGIDMAVSTGIPYMIGAGIAVALKLVLIIGTTLLLTRSGMIKRLFAV